jgi:N-acylneuraminate cytidylyltransferase
MSPFFYDAGQFYWSHVDPFDDELPHGRVGYVEIPESECQDIDNEEDWKLAEIKYEYMLRTNKF